MVFFRCLAMLMNMDGMSTNNSNQVLSNQYFLNVAMKGFDNEEG
jgi:hypothetical protein